MFILLNSNIYANTKIDKLISEDKLTCFKNSYSEKHINDALNEAKKCKNDDITTLIKWLYLYENKDIDINYNEKFIKEISNFPLFKKIQKKIEPLILDNSLIIPSFLKTPQTKDGFITLIKNSEDISEKKNIIKKYFLSTSFPITEFKEFYKKYKNFLPQEVLKEKIELFLFKTQISNANIIIAYMDNSYQKLFHARIAFIKKSFFAFRYLKNIPKTLKGDEGLYYDIIRYYQKKGQDKKVTHLLLSLNKTKYPKKWFPIRMYNARALYKNKEYKLAYKIVSSHNLKAGSSKYADIEWFAGWMSLSYLDSPKLAIHHFTNLKDNVSYAISKSRGYYWLARSHSLSGDKLQAKFFYHEAAKYPAYFYGQMAILELEDKLRINLPKNSITSIKNIKISLNKNIKLRTSIYLSHLNKINLSYIFLKDFMDKNPSEENIKLAISIARYTGNLGLISKVSRYGARYNVITLANYPLIKNLEKNNPNNSLILAIIKQESGFNTNAKSSVGALGFMQLMPATARDVARRLKIKYSKQALRKDPNYNIKLGSYYINHLLKRFDNSYILSIASYNAGASNVKRWIKEFGDPRNLSSNHKIINWIESITFSETRNYVQRILENTVIYAHLLEERE